MKHCGSELAICPIAWSLFYIAVIFDEGATGLGLPTRSLLTSLIFGRLFPLEEFWVDWVCRLRFLFILAMSSPNMSPVLSAEMRSSNSPSPCLVRPFWPSFLLAFLLRSRSALCKIIKIYFCNYKLRDNRKCEQLNISSPWLCRLWYCSFNSKCLSMVLIGILILSEYRHLGFGFP